MDRYRHGETPSQTQHYASQVQNENVICSLFIDIFDYQPLPLLPKTHRESLCMKELDFEVIENQISYLSECITYLLRSWTHTFLLNKQFELGKLPADLKSLII